MFCKLCGTYLVLRYALSYTHDNVMTMKSMHHATVLCMHMQANYVRLSGPKCRAQRQEQGEVKNTSLFNFRCCKSYEILRTKMLSPCASTGWHFGLLFTAATVLKDVIIKSGIDLGLSYLEGSKAIMAAVRWRQLRRRFHKVYRL